MILLNRLKYWGYIKLRKYKYLLKGIKRDKRTDPKKFRFGKENSDKTFYVARRFSEVEGHCSMVMTMLGHFYLAERMGMIPVVDMKNYYSQLWQDESKRGKENSWEYFYEQPAGFTMEDISKSKNVFLSDGVHSRKAPNYRTTFDKKDDIVFWNEIYKKYVRLNPTAKDIVEREIEQAGIQSKKVLAVAVRRGIEWGHKVKDEGFACHCDVPDLEEIIEKTKEMKKQWKCDKVFLTIDDCEGLELFKREFKEDLLYIERDRWKYFENGIPNPNAEKDFVGKESKFEKEIKYLSELFIISQCESFIGTRSSTSLGAMVIKGSVFENSLIYGE